MIYLTRVPAAPLSYFVELLWFYENLETDHSKEKLLPDASMELIIDLSDGPKKLYDNRDLERYSALQPLLGERNAAAVYRAWRGTRFVNDGSALPDRRGCPVLWLSVCRSFRAMSWNWI